MELDNTVEKDTLIQEVKVNLSKFICDHDYFIPKFDVTVDANDSDINKHNDLVKHALTHARSKDTTVQNSNITDDEKDPSSIIANTFRSQLSWADLEIFEQQVDAKRKTREKLKELTNELDKVLTKLNENPDDHQVATKIYKILVEIKKDFMKQQLLMDNLLTKRFSKEFKTVLTKLVDSYFEDKTKYIPVPSIAGVMQHETMLSIVQFNPKNLSEFRLRRLF